MAIWETTSCSKQHHFASDNTCVGRRCACDSIDVGHQIYITICDCLSSTRQKAVPHNELKRFNSNSRSNLSNINIYQDDRSCINILIILSSLKWISIVWIKIILEINLKFFEWSYVADDHYFVNSIHWILHWITVLSLATIIVRHLKLYIYSILS